MMGLCSAYFAILTDTIILTTNEFQKKTNENHIRSYEKFDEQVYSDLSQCVEHHLAVIKFTETIEDIFSYVFLSQFLCSAFGICVTGFILIKAKPGGFEFMYALLYLAALMFQITLYCTYGNEITIQSYRVLEACYMTEWVYCGPKVRQNLFLIMERSKRPVVMTAGKFVTLSLALLVSVFQSAASYAMVLYQMYNA
ncbi:odorant receptor 94a-like isoform X2 [Photinus pyralis]|nr:odorant receptor 94a-like isoform X2 [Photinus pyralis]